MASENDLILERFGKHVPKILHNQLISNLVESVIQAKLNPSSIPLEATITCTPTVQRFHGVLLFVDISGFTVLSQRLSVDDLRTHINSYFKRILDIIGKYEGEVIKFAGDALFALWHTKINSFSPTGMMMYLITNDELF